MQKFVVLGLLLAAPAFALPRTVGLHHPERHLFEAQRGVGRSGLLSGTYRLEVPDLAVSRTLETIPAERCNVFLVWSEGFSFGGWVADHMVLDLPHGDNVLAGSFVPEGENFRGDVALDGKKYPATVRRVSGAQRFTLQDLTASISAVPYLYQDERGTTFFHKTIGPNGTGLRVRHASTPDPYLCYTLPALDPEAGTAAVFGYEKEPTLAVRYDVQTESEHEFLIVGSDKPSVHLDKISGVLSLYSLYADTAFGVDLLSH